MAKQPSAIAEFFINMALPYFLQIGGTAFSALLQKAYTDNSELIKTMVISLYPFVDVYLERAAEKSKTKIDDKIVTEFKTAIETFAEENSIELPNLDND